MSTELKKKWYQGFALYSTIFICAMYGCFNNISIAKFISEYGLLYYFFYNFLLHIFLGGFLFFVKRKVPFFELLIFNIFDSVFISDFYINTFIINYIIALVGSFLSLFIISLLNKKDILRKVKINLISFIKDNNKIYKKNHSVNICFVYTYFFYLSYS